MESPPFWIAKPGATTTLGTGKKTYAVGEPVDVSWQLAPGNRWDWLGVYKRGADPNVAYYKLWGYTGATVDGQLQIDETSNGSPWPLPPGKYDVILLKDDSYAEIARAPFTVQR